MKSRWAATRRSRSGNPCRSCPTLQLNTVRRQVGKQLAARARGPRYPYSFSIANYRELNAFALPGGPVWINRGILHAAATEAQLAGVLAHEIAHIAAAPRRGSDHQAAGGERLSRSAGRGARQRSRRSANRTGRRSYPGRRLHAEVQSRRRARGGRDRLSRSCSGPAGIRAAWRSSWKPCAASRDAIRARSRSSCRRIPHPQSAPRRSAARLGTRTSGRRDSAAFRAAKARALRLTPAASIEVNGDRCSARQLPVAQFTPSLAVAATTDRRDADGREARQGGLERRSLHP